MGFVTRSGNQFMLDGQRFRNIGGNFYSLAQSANIDEDYLHAYFTLCRKDGVKVVRCWCYDVGSETGTGEGNFRYRSGTSLLWNEVTFVNLDRVLYVARLYGVKIMLSLMDNNLSRKERYCTWSDAIHGTTFNSAVGRSVASLTRVTTVMTCQTAAAHDYAVGDNVTISGANETGYNGTRRIASIVDSTTFTMNTGISEASPATGTITVTRPVSSFKFYTDTNIRTWYQEFVTYLSERTNTFNNVAYVSDDTIFSWELINEGRHDQSNDPAINTSNSHNYAALGKAGGWADVMSAHVKSKFPNHLVGFGDLKFTTAFVTNDAYKNGSVYGTDFVGTGSLDNIDYVDLHLYPYQFNNRDLRFGNSQYWGVNLGFSATANIRRLIFKNSTSDL